MRTARAFALMAILAVAPLCASAASYRVSPPDPVGEKIYHSGQPERLLPIPILVGGLFAAWVLNRIRRHSRKLHPEDGEPHHC